MGLASYETDLELNGYRSVLEHEQTFQQVVTFKLEGSMLDGAAELWKETDETASQGSYASEGRVRLLKVKDQAVAAKGGCEMLES